MSQSTLFDGLQQETITKPSGPVRCLGQTFASDEERRKHFTALLREKLQDPEFRKIEGFPHGEDEDILNLSDPPYYTACPNPWLTAFIAEWEAQKPTQPEEYHYHREPFAADVSEGKNHPIYNAHSYHTKVPHKAIMRYILHYTNPGDIVFDGFCGTGMTGVAAQLCGDRNAVLELGYQVKLDGTILQEEIDENGKKDWGAFSKLGVRRAALNDLSPAATFISKNYGYLNEIADFCAEASKVIKKAEKDLSWLYLTKSGQPILSAIWSDVFLCQNCSSEIIYWDAAITNGKIEKFFPCPSCGTIVGKCSSKKAEATKLDRSFETIFDQILKEVITVPKFIVVINIIKASGGRQSVSILPEERDAYLSILQGQNWSSVPENRFFPGRQTNKLINGSGISYVYHMYTPRALFAYSYLWQLELSSHKNTSLFRFCLSSINNYISRKQGYFGGGGGVSGTLFTPSIHLERNIFDVLKRKIKKIQSLDGKMFSSRTVASTQSVTDVRNILDSSIDYIFTDPPFGESLQYSELNLFVEAWLKVETTNTLDCVLNYVHKKDLAFYSETMALAFREYHRILKPSRWITIEFHNSQNSVWSSIQQAIESSGMIVADVRVLNKQQRSFNAVNRAGAVDQDLVISAYKPDSYFEKVFSLTSGSSEGVWEFARSHLNQLPVFVSNDGIAEIIVERQSFLLFDRMVAFHVQRGLTVPVSAAEFYEGLEQRYSKRDCMFFLTEQVSEYDKKRILAKEIRQLTIFITDEASAIQWLRQLLQDKPQSFSDIHPQFLKELGGWSKSEITLELSTLLNQNFLCYDGKELVPEQIHAYLSSNWKELRNLPKDDSTLVAKASDRWYLPDPNKTGDLEKLRERALLKEFGDYKQAGKKLKVFRLEAVRAGFKKCWQDRDYATIVAVADKIPNNVLEEDPKLLMWYDQAVTRMGD
ncbi:MAG: DNA methyltransferase [Methylococcaceae bacterium]